MNNKRNLEAYDQAYKGLVRSPFAFLIGGPCGLIINAVYSVIQINDEVQRENAHKKYLEDTGIYGNPDVFADGRKKLLDERAKKQEKSDSQLHYLRDEFDYCEDRSIEYDCWVKYNSKKPFTHADKYYDAIIHTGSSLNDIWKGRYLPEKEFIDNYKRDKASGKIIKKYRFYNNNVRMTFGYKTENDFLFTGMFTQI